MFTRLLVVACVCIIVALILYFFYWNRFIAFVIGQIIRILYWNQEASSIWVEIGSIHFSLLAGRVLFKDFCYHSSNQTIKVVKGQIQWRYWIRRPTSEEELAMNRGEGSKVPERWHLCRIHISLQGYEWFLYNRTAAYDGIISQMESLARPPSRASERQRPKSRQDVPSTIYPPSTMKRPSRVPAVIRDAFTWLKQQLPNLDPKDLLPLGIEVTTGAIIVGNPSTPNLLVAEFHSADGNFGVVPSRSPYDLYKQVLTLKFRNALIRYVENEDYVDSMNAVGHLLHERIQRYNTVRTPASYMPYKAFSRLWRQVQLFELVMQYFSERREHRALHRNMLAASRLPSKKGKKLEEEETPIGIDFSTYEYAVERKILEAPTLELTYYVDVVGEVPPLPHTDPFSRGDIVDIGNGDTAPEWGVDMVISGGFLKYGPWADRQRAESQRAFFPPTYQNAVVTPRLKPGDKRLWTALQVFVELRGETTLQVPFREASKDWQWDGKSDTPKRPKKRESASFNLTVGDRSSISYIMPMVAGPAGYESTFEVHLDAVAATSSLNDIRLIYAESCRVRCELPSPLQWNQERTWGFSIFLRQPTLYILRDHINMFTDLGKDWASGPPTDYQKFIPMIYSVKFEMHHYEVNLYVNDQNIIDKPRLREDNAFLILRGPNLKNEATIASNKFRPEATSVPFAIDAPDLTVDFSVPRWSTHALHAPELGHSLLKAGSLALKGSYRYHAESRAGHVDQLKLDLQLRETAFKALGWSIRYFLALKDNYFGSFTHFSTLYEYLDKRRNNLPLGDPIVLKYREGKHNMLQVEIALQVDDGLVAFPAGFLGYQTSSFNPRSPAEGNRPADTTGACLLLKLPHMQVDMRLHDYFMEMSVNIDVARGYINATVPERVAYSDPLKSSKEVLFIDGIDVVANRLFGPLPRTATYLCIWEIQIGKIRTALSAFETKILAAVGNAFRLHFVDIVNAPAVMFMPPIDPDITFYKICIDSVEITWRAGDAALVISLDQGIKFNSNDLAAQHYRKVTNLRIPHMNARILVTSSSKGASWLEAAEVSADALLDLYSAPEGYRVMNQSQSAFVEEQDRNTGRVERMLAALKKRGRVRYSVERSGSLQAASHQNGVYLPQPMLPNADHRSKTRSFVPPATQAVQERPPTWRLSTLANLSDSDGEDGVSEADRDARLARTRFSASKIQRFKKEEDPMSSGDESDDADLTDGDSLNSDWSDIADSPNAQPESAMLSFYSPLTRHYYLNPDGLPGLWDGPAFSLAREKSPLAGRGIVDDPAAKPLDLTPVEILEGSSEDHDTTIIRFRSRRPLLVKVTPLVTLASSFFEQDIHNIPADSELMVDSLMRQYMAKNMDKGTSGTCLMFDVAAPLVGLTIVHHVALPEDDRPPMDRLEIGKPSRLDSTAILDLNIADISFTGAVIENQVALRFGIRRVTSRIDLSIDKRTLLSSSPSLTIFDASISGFSIEISRQSLRCRLQEIGFNMGHRGPEVMALVSLSLMATSSALSPTFSAINKRQDVLDRNILCDILKSSENKSIVDTLSTIQPSYLVQSGVPWQLRSDPGFRFLFHLRDCMAALTGSDFHNRTYGGSDELTSLLNSRLSMLDQDTVNLSQLPGLFGILPGLHLQPPPDSNRHKRPPLASAELQLDNIRLSVLDPQGQATSEFKVGDIQCAIRTDKLELIQLTTGHPTSMSQTSLRDKAPRTVKRLSASLSLGEVSLVVFPHLMPFIQHILRVRRQYFSTSRTSKIVPSQDISVKFSKVLNINLVVSWKRLRIRAAAENLVFEFGIVALQSSSAVLSAQSTGDYSMNHALFFQEIYIQARSPSDLDKENPQDILAAIVFKGGKGSALSKEEESLSKATHRLIFTINEFRIDVPRSALRLYRFAAEWRADYLPGIESTVKSMLSEIKSKPDKPTSSPPVPPSRNTIFYVTGSVTRIGIVLQVMHGTWLTWEAHDVLAYAKSPITNIVASPHTFGLQISSVILNVSPTPGPPDPLASSRVRLVLPPLSVAGHYDGSCIHTLALVDFIELKVKPSHWDTLLAVQQKFGHDFNDLMGLMQETRLKQPSPSLQAPRQSLQYGAFIKMKGFRVGLEGLSSTLYLECLDIRGGMNNGDGFFWDLGLTGLALSLAPRALGGLAYNRLKRSAFVTIDFKIMGNDGNNTETLVKNLDVSVTKIHAVMQASSIGEVGDFVDHLQAEMLDRREQRAGELAAFKEKTQTILKTFEVKVHDVQLEETTTWLGDYVVNVSIQNVGVAFPLAHDHELTSFRVSADVAAIRAFLFSIQSITFSTNRGETGQAIMQRLCFQFVPRFRQSSPEDFTAERHHTRNCLLYPEMKAYLRSSTTASSRKFWIDANVDGFILDLDSTIPDYIFSLIDVYRQGKERVERLSATVPRTPSTPMPIIAETKSYDKHYTALLTSNVFASFTFLSGKVRTYSGSAAKQFRSRSLSNAFQELSDEQVLGMGAEVFNLPVVSVWAEYRATPASQKLSSDPEAEPSLLMFKSTVHSSRNTLRPTLLPFITEVINRVESRMRTISSHPSRPPTISTPTALTASHLKPPNHDAESVSSMQLSFSLRIDQSKLEFTCQPDVNVVAAVNWESGGFTLNISPGARKVSFTGAVGGLAIGLRHGFLSEDCVNLDARNLTFSVSFSKMDTSGGDSVNSISIVLDTEFLGGVRFSRLQDILCCKAVWLDRIPVFNNYSPAETPSPPKTNIMPFPSSIEAPKKQELSTVALIRIRQIQVSIDLGQSISFITLDAKNAILRSKLTEVLNEVSIFVEDVSILAKGNLAGRIHVPDCLFQTIHRSDQFSLGQVRENRMLELKMTSGTLIAVLESDHQKLLHYRAEPLEVEIFDDWSLAIPKVDEEGPLQLSFVVNSPEILMVATIGTIPKIMSYINKFKSNLDAQRQGASRESKTYWATRTPQPDNPLSAVAEAMLHSARSRFNEVEPRLSFVIRQHMSLKLDSLRLVVFPRSMNDIEMAQFVGKQVRAQLDRLIGSETRPAKRDLHLSFVSMTISKHTHSHLPPAPLEGYEGYQGLVSAFKDAHEATIVGLPSMKIHMVSEETTEGRLRSLVYDFKSVFVRSEEMKAYEDIYITLNMSLYAWLTVLRKNLAREMDQVRATEDWRTSLTAALVSASPSISGTGAVRKKVPEPLNLTSDATRFPLTSSSGPGFVVSPAYLSPPGVPASARYPSIEGAARAAAMQLPKSPASAQEPSISSLLSPVPFPSSSKDIISPEISPAPSGMSGVSGIASSSSAKPQTINYLPRERHIERLTMRQLGEATPDVMHPFFMKKAGFNLEDSLPQYVHEYATIPLGQIMEVLLSIYSQQLLKKQEGDALAPSEASSPDTSFSS